MLVLDEETQRVQKEPPPAQGCTPSGASWQREDVPLFLSDPVLCQKLDQMSVSDTMDIGKASLQVEKTTIYDKIKIKCQLPTHAVL